MDAKKCDRCGKFYEECKPTYEVRKLLYAAPEDGNFVYAGETIDLCLDCTDALVRFLFDAEHKENK